MFKKDCIVGIDIGPSSVKAARFTVTENALRLEKAELKEIPVVSGDGDNEYVEAVRKILKNIDHKRTKIVANINCEHTAIKRVAAPYMPKSELSDGIRLEAKSYFPFPIDESLVEYEVVGDINDKGVRKHEVVVAACPADTAQRYIKIFDKAEIKPASFVPSAYSLQKSGDRSYASEGRTNCYMDIGGTHTELVISKGGHLIFTRKIPVSGNDFTRSMMVTLASDRGKIQLSFAEAERIKKEVGLPQEGSPAIIENKISTTEILSMLRAPLEQLTGEIERCFDYYREETGGGAIDSLILFGGGASLKGLDKALAEALGMEVRLGDPLTRLDTGKELKKEPGLMPHRFALAIGAGLSESAGINLLPADIKDAKKILITRGTIEAAATAFILTAVFLFIGMNMHVSNLDKKIAVTKMELSGISGKVARAEMLLRAKKIMADEPQWEDLFAELSNLIPENIYVNELVMKESSLTIKGVAVAKDGEQVLADFMLVLENGIFDRVRLVNTRKLGENAGTEFEIHCWIDYETV